MNVGGRTTTGSGMTAADFAPNSYTQYTLFSVAITVLTRTNTNTLCNRDWQLSSSRHANDAAYGDHGRRSHVPAFWRSTGTPPTLPESYACLGDGLG